MPSLLNDPNPVDMILFSHELFSGDHQLVQVVHNAEGRADSDAEVPGRCFRSKGHTIGEEKGRTCIVRPPKDRRSPSPGAHIHRLPPL